MAIHPKTQGSAFTRAIREDCYDFFDLMGVEEVRHYMGAFPRNTDYNLVDYGCMRVYYDDIRDLFEQCGNNRIKETYKRHNYATGANPGDYKISNDELWRMYQAYTGEAAIAYVKANA